MPLANDVVDCNDGIGFDTLIGEMLVDPELKEAGACMPLDFDMFLVIPESSL
jgi:hypothetical protein